MNEKNIPFFKVQSVNDMLASTFDDLQSQVNKYVGQNISIKGRLLNVEDQLVRNKYPSAYQLVLEDSTDKIEIEILKKYIAGFKDGDYVEVIGQPKFRLYKDTISKKFQAYMIKSAEMDSDIGKLKSDLDNFDKLRKFPPKAISFPYKDQLNVTVIYSSATNVKIAEDFYKHLSGHKNYCRFNEITVSLSDDFALSNAINQAQGSDVVVMIRGGGSPEHFKIFNSDRILDSFSKLDAYRIVGLGHNTDVTLLDYIVDHSAYTPLDAGLHLRDQIEKVISRDNKALEALSKLNRYQRDIYSKDEEIQRLKIENGRLPSLEEVSALRDKNSLLEAKLEIKPESSKVNHATILIAVIIAAFFGCLLGMLIF